MLILSPCSNLFIVLNSLLTCLETCLTSIFSSISKFIPALFPRCSSLNPLFSLTWQFLTSIITPSFNTPSSICFIRLVSHTAILTTPVSSPNKKLPTFPIPEAEPGFFLLNSLTPYTLTTFPIISTEVIPGTNSLIFSLLFILS